MGHFVLQAGDEAKKLTLEAALRIETGGRSIAESAAALQAEIRAVMGENQAQRGWREPGCRMKMNPKEPSP